VIVKENLNRNECARENVVKAPIKKKRMSESCLGWFRMWGRMVEEPIRKVEQIKNKETPGW